MHLVLQVVFNYDIRGRYFKNFAGNISDIADLQKAVQEYYTGDSLQPLSVARTVQIIDMDKPIRPAGVSVREFLAGNKQYKIIEIVKEILPMYIGQKIMYPRDVRKILIKKYGSVLDFGSRKKLDEKQPISDFFVNEDTHYGLRDPRTGSPTKQTLRSVYCKYAEPTDIIVDKNLNQIWPIKTKQPPKELVDLLARNKEKIYEG